MADLKLKAIPPLVGIAGLGNALTDAKAGIAEVKKVTAALGSETAALIRDVNIVRTHVNTVHSDLQFEAGQLGNGGETTSANASGTSAPVGGNVPVAGFTEAKKE